MSCCQACGGLIGRDCFNPQECMGITRDMADRYQTSELDANNLRGYVAHLEERLNTINELFADIRKAVGGNCLGDMNHSGEERPVNYTRPWLPKELVLRIDGAMNREQRN